MGQERKVGHIKLNRVYPFLGHGEAKYLFLVWLSIANLVMPVHYSLFKHDTWFQNRKPEAKQKISDFIDGSTGGPVRTCLGSLAEMLLESRGRDRCHLRILSLKVGGAASMRWLRAHRGAHGRRPDTCSATKGSEKTDGKTSSTPRVKLRSAGMLGTGALGHLPGRRLGRSAPQSSLCSRGTHASARQKCAAPRHSR